MDMLDVLTGQKYDGNLGEVDYMEMIGNIYGFNVSLMTLMDWTIEQGGDVSVINKVLNPAEPLPMKGLLQQYKCLGEVYHNILKESNWVWQQEDDYISENNDIGILDGEIILTNNGSIHYIRDILQLLAFKMYEKWWIWTPKGFDSVNCKKSDAMIRQIFTFNREQTKITTNRDFE